MKRCLLFGLFLWQVALLSAQSCPTNLTFTTQAQIDNFAADYPGCTHISGYVTISGADITNLDGLWPIMSIGGQLTLYNNAALTSLAGLEQLTSVGLSLVLENNAALTSIGGLNQLTSVGGQLIIRDNNTLTSLGGLEQLTSVGSYFRVAYNEALTSLCDLHHLTSIEGTLEVDNNAALTSIDGLNQLTSVGGQLIIRDNNTLTSLDGLNQLTSIGGLLNIRNNAALTSISGVNQLTSIGQDVRVSENDALTSLAGLKQLTSIGGSLSIQYNDALTSLDGLEQLTSVGQSVYFENNAALTNLDALNQLTSIGGNLGISSNPSLTSLGGLGRLTSIEGGLFVNNNDALTSLDGLGQLTSIGGSLGVGGNDALTSLSGLNNIDPATITHLSLQSSGNLSICDVQSICDYLANPANPANIGGNALGCNSRSEIETACSGPPPMAVCRNISVQLDDMGQISLTPNQVDGGSSGGALSINIDVFGCDKLGLNTLTLTVTDAAGNRDACTADVTVEDKTRPNISCSGGSVFFNGEAGFSVTAAVTSSAVDNCGSTSGPTYTPAVVTCQQVGQNVPVIVSYSDAEGNIGRCTTSVQVSGLPCGFEDTGGIGCSSQASYNAASGVFTLQTNGCANANAASDQHGFIAHELCGNGSISFRVAGLSSANALAGIILRAGPAPGAVKAELVTNRATIGRRAVRTTPNTVAWPTNHNLVGRYWLKVERLGSQVRLYSSANGQNWSVVTAVTLSLPSCVQVGMIAYGAGMVTATFDDVRINGSALLPGGSALLTESTDPDVEDTRSSYFRPACRRHEGRLPTSDFRQAPLPSPPKGGDYSVECLSQSHDGHTHRGTAARHLAGRREPASHRPVRAGAASSHDAGLPAGTGPEPLAGGYLPAARTGRRWGGMDGKDRSGGMRRESRGARRESRVTRREARALRRMLVGL